ncbi:beta-propeller domain-containing protein [Micromonospora sp. NPDC049282]|uniref:beta-propeller domain-containing protein n=1 Tax=Micromonospora sp. NPDC049282 TaxID=3364269 RepID=UPI00371529F9
MVAALTLAGCTAHAPAPPPPRDRGVPAGGLRLVAFDSCDEALRQLKTAAKAAVGPWGLGGDVVVFDGAERTDGSVAAKDAAGAPAAGFSGTTVHEAGVDEPDLVKTDGRRIVTVSRGVLSVVDPASRRLTGRLALDPPAEQRYAGGEANLLLHGDRALVLLPARWVGGPAAAKRRPAPGAPQARLVLVDLAGAPTIVGDYRIDGRLVDARQVGATTRVVIRSTPRLAFPQPAKGTDAQRTAANRVVIDKATLDDWLPRYQVREGGRTATGRVGCDRLSRPAGFSGASMVTVLSFDLGASALGAGDPVTVAADGDTVYSSGPRLYLTNDQRWRMPVRRGASPGQPDGATEIYQFDLAAGTPRYVAAGSVPGRLINQYALSEWNGHLRVATTTGDSWGGPGRDSVSGIHVLRTDGATLTQVGQVTGLGRGEQIYAVRFLGPTGYVVTFRQTDPLYAVDLRDPAAPRVTGELKINGYSSYLHPAGDGRLLGVGQEATDRGRVQGVQVSLFDVADPARPARIAQHHVARGWSDAESDPHAFLWWAPERLVVLPVMRPGVVTDRAGGGVGRGTPSTGVLALRVGADGFTVAGTVEHPPSLVKGMEWTPIRRSLMVDGVLWTVSDAGLKATGLAGLTTLAWVPTT